MHTYICIHIYITCVCVCAPVRGEAYSYRGARMPYFYLYDIFRKRAV